MQNPLDSRPQLRERLYLVQWLVNLIVGVAGIVLTALGLAPSWFTIAVSALSFVWTYLGLTASSNVQQGAPDARADIG